MLWSDFCEGFWDWSDSTRRTRISSLEDIGSGDEVVDAVLEIDDRKIKAQLIRKAMKLGAKFTADDFQNLEGELPFEVYEELGKYAGFDADNPTYDKADTSWSHFYDNFTEWDPYTQTAAIKNLRQMGKSDEIVDAILNLVDQEQRALLMRKAIASKVKFTHEDFENLQDELPDVVYRELAAYTGLSVDCPDYNKDNHTWKYFYINCCDWTEEIQLSAIASLRTLGSPKEVAETILDLDNESAKVALANEAIKRNLVFPRECLQDIDGELPDNLFRKLLDMAGIPEDDLHFDEENMTWDDFECSYSDWPEELLAKRISILKEFGDPESVCGVIQCMPTSELEDALYDKAIECGVTFAEEQLENMGHVEHQLKNALDNFLTDDQIDQFVANAEAIVDNYEQEKKRQKRIGFWGTIIGIFSGISKASSNHAHSHHCNGDCANCPPHYGYRYGRWYYGHGHQWGCERGGNGGASGRTNRD